jgi:hypothetical protein
MSYYARATPWGTIQYGSSFGRLTSIEQQAVVAHERGHIVHRHALKRLAWFVTLRVFFNTSGYFQMCEAQELEADRYAANIGHANGLIRFLLCRTTSFRVSGYPSREQRLENLRG